MNNEELEITLIENQQDIIYQQDKALIDVQIATAKAFPRNLRRSIDNAIAYVTIDIETAQSCNYALPRAGKSITGPSVHLAKIIAYEWGNLRSDSRVVNIDGKHVTAEAVCFDLEKNVAVKVQVKRRITTKYGKTFDDDMITVTGNAACAIALRNAIFSVIPKPQYDKVYKAALSTITGDISDENKLKATRKVLFDSLKDLFGVTEAEALAVVGKAAIDFVTREDIVVLVGVRQAIKDGDTDVETAFRKQPEAGKSKEESELERVLKAIENSKALKELDSIKKKCGDDLFEKVREKWEEKRNAIADKLDSSEQ